MIKTFYYNNNFTMEFGLLEITVIILTTALIINLLWIMYDLNKQWNKPSKIDKISNKIDKEERGKN